MTYELYVNDCLFCSCITLDHVLWLLDNLSDDIEFKSVKFVQAKMIR